MKVNTLPACVVTCHSKVSRAVSYKENFQQALSGLADFFLITKENQIADQTNLYIVHPQNSLKSRSLKFFPRVLVLQIDYHKPLPCSKVSAKNSHFLRKLRTNPFGSYCANETNIHCFFYDDSIGTAGPNQVIFLLNHLLNKLETKNGKYNHLIVWLHWDSGCGCRVYST